MRCIQLFWILICVCYVNSQEPRVDPLVNTEQGFIRGEKSVDDTYSMFLGIPYARVFVENPFGPSAPIPPSRNVFEATDGSTMCPQSFDYIPKTNKQTGPETLDCLTLNIYVPSQAGSKNPLPVLVWIHGGDFSGGSAGEYHPKTLLDHNIIVVTINYRLGPYGFLCLDIPSVPGNQGLKDQYEALLWIRKNIAAFGGNPYKVTLAGQGAGSISTLLHLYSPRTKLFDKVIAQSGTSKAYMLDKDYQAAIKLANYLDNNATTTEDAVNFLAKTSFELVTGAVTATKLNLGPCAEKSYSGIENFLDTNPYMATNEKKVTGTPILIGHTSTEIPGFAEQGTYSTDPFYKTLDDNFSFEDLESVENVAYYVRNFYIGDAELNNIVLDQVGAFSSDFQYNHPTQRTIDSLLKENAGEIYQYVFSFVSNKTANGAVHSDELPYLFDGLQNFEALPDNSSFLVAQHITSLWTNFVKNGKPTPSATGNDAVSWPRVTAQTRPYMLIEPVMRVAKSRVFNDRMAFWDLFYFMYNDRHKLYRNCI